MIGRRFLHGTGFLFGRGQRLSGGVGDKTFPDSELPSCEDFLFFSRLVCGIIVVSASGERYLFENVVLTDFEHVASSLQKRGLQCRNAAL